VTFIHHKFAICKNTSQDSLCYIQLASICTDCDLQHYESRQPGLHPFLQASRQFVIQPMSQCLHRSSFTTLTKRLTIRLPKYTLITFFHILNMIHVNIYSMTRHMPLVDDQLTRLLKKVVDFGSKSGDMYFQLT